MTGANKHTVKVAIADDHKLFKEGMKLALSAFKDLELVMEADNGQHLLDHLKKNVPDVILLDLQMPIMDGFTALTEIKHLYPNVKVIILSMNNEQETVGNLLKLGANSYLTKTSDPKNMHDTIMNCYHSS